MREVLITLPYPVGISVNSVWQYSKKGVYLNTGVRKFRDTVFWKTRGVQPFNDDPVKLEIKMYPPDKRKRDIDNILKVVLDALQNARIYENDYQVQKLYIEKMPIKEGGELEVKVISLA